MEKPGNPEPRVGGQGSLYLASGMMNFAGVIAMVAVSYYAKRYLGASLMQLALLTFLGNGVYVVCCPILGSLSERYGRPRFIVAATLVFATAYFGALLSTQVWHLYFVVCLSGLGHALFWPSVEAELAAEADTHQLRRRMGRFNISWSTGDIAGALVAGVGLTLSPRLPFLLCVVTGVGISVLTARSRMSSASAESRVRHEEAVNGHDLPENHDTFWKMALVANFFSAGVISIVRRLFPDLAVDSLNYTGLQWGFLVMVVALSRTVMFAVLERHHGWLYRPKRFFAVQLLFPLGCFLILFAQSYWVFILAFACIGAASGVVYSSSLFYSVHGAGRQAHRAGLHESVLGLGAGLIPLMAGPTRSLAAPYWKEAIRAPYVLGAVLFAVAITVQLVIFARSRRARQTKTAS